MAEERGGIVMIYVIGTGPGNIEDMTERAKEGIKKAKVILGYKTYIRLIEPLLEGKEVIQNGMRGEVERCREAVNQAKTGADVALVSGGDPGVYAMAGLLLEIVAQEAPEVRVEIIPGVTSANAAAAALGAPLMHDHAYISLSDCLTDWSLIEKRLRLAAEGDFVICLFNPKSHARNEHLTRACKILMEIKSKETPVGIVTHAARAEQVVELTSLMELPKREVSMSSMVIIGNRHTFRFNDFLITPRGYPI